MRGIFYPKVRMGRVLRECMQDGNSRLEITYTARSRHGENELFHPLFGQKAIHDLDKAQFALDQVNGLAWVIPINDLFGAFISGARASQLLIVQPSIVAMVYADNSKAGSYTGFWQLATPT